MVLPNIDHDRENARLNNFISKQNKDKYNYKDNQPQQF
jgi:hypothetical protein